VLHGPKLTSFLYKTHHENFAVIVSIVHLRKNETVRPNYVDVHITAYLV